MSIVDSVLFGQEGKYTVFGASVQFEKEPPFGGDFLSLEGAGLISKVAAQCINSDPFRWIFQGCAHVFVHEMFHALAYNALVDRHASVRIFTGPCVGITEIPDLTTDAIPRWKITMVCLAGPVGNVAFSICKLIAATAFKGYFCLPIAFALGGGAVIWISGELLYATLSALKEDDGTGMLGDFGIIRSVGGTLHLALASAILVSECALAVFATMALCH